MNRRGGRGERRVPHEERPQGPLGEERRALGRDILAAPHAVVDLEVQGFVLLLGSERQKGRGIVRRQHETGNAFCRGLILLEKEKKTRT